MERTKEEAPKAYSLRVTENALQNLDSITGYIAYIKHEPLNAIRVGDEILKTIDRIEKNPSAFGNVKKFRLLTKYTAKLFALAG